jgi:hypothetical protein
MKRLRAIFAGFLRWWANADRKRGGGWNVDDDEAP